VLARVAVSECVAIRTEGTIETAIRLEARDCDLPPGSAAQKTGDEQAAVGLKRYGSQPLVADAVALDRDTTDPERRIWTEKRACEGRRF
jgi:hypothetical protein